MDLADAVTAADVAIDRIAAASVEDCDGAVLRDELRTVKRMQSKLDAQLARLTHAADSVGAFIGTGARDTAEWLGKETGTSTRKNRTAAELGEAMAKSDELTDAVVSGRLSADQAASAVSAAGGELLDQELIDTIADLPLPGVRPAVEQWRNRCDPDGDAARAEAQRGRRYVRLTDQPDGMTRIEGLLDPASGAAVRTTLDGVISQSVFDGTGRTRDQRRADALTQLCVAESKGDIVGGRSNTKIIATVPFETITERSTARGVTHAGPTLDADSVRKLACDAGVHRMITGPGSSILDFGHENRLVSDNQFLALVARDHQCRWPGCTIRGTWCDAHHIVPRCENGPTRLENLVLLCDRHHHLGHQPGWTVTGTGDRLTIAQPDGAVETSRAPHRPPPQPEPPPPLEPPPPSADGPRPAPTGREPTHEAAHTASPSRSSIDPGDDIGEQLSLT